MKTWRSKPLSVLLLFCLASSAALASLTDDINPIPGAAATVEAGVVAKPDETKVAFVTERISTPKPIRAGLLGLSDTPDPTSIIIDDTEVVNLERRQSPLRRLMIWLGLVFDEPIQF